MCEETGIDTFCAAINELAASWFEGAPISERSERMAEFILSGGVYGNMENHIAVQRAGQNKPRGKWSYIFSRAWLPLHELKTSYPVLERRPYLLPIYQIKRWGAAIASGRIKKSASEIKTNDSIATEQIQGVALLLSELGL